MRPLRAIALAASLLLGSSVAGAFDLPRPRTQSMPPQMPFVQPFVQPAPSYCWIAARVFDTLRNGPFDYCRRKLRYRPGALECFTFTDQVCAVLLPSGEWTETRNVITRQPFPCPRGPEPPVCRRLDMMGVGQP